MAGQLDHRCAEPVSPAITILEVVQQAPRLMELLTPEGVKALTATCKQLRQGLRCSVTTIRIANHQATGMLQADKWPSLVKVVVSSTHNVGQEQSENHPESYLPKKDWSTLLSLTGHQAFTNDVSLVRQSVALVVRASHQSSQDLDTRAHGIALARFAKAWQGKTQSICMYLNSNSPHMDPVKRLQTGSWPHLWFIICHGNPGNALPISCFWGEGSSNMKHAEMSHCHLDAEAVQSLVTGCPHLSVLTLAGCKLEAAALSCLNQARLSRLERLDLSKNPLGWSGVWSLSSCHLPALLWLSLDDTNLNALAAMYLAQGQWPKLEHLRLCDNQLNVEAVAHLVKGQWPLLQKLGLSWTYVPEAAFAVLGVVDACKQFEKHGSDKLHFLPVCLERSGFFVWPRLHILTVQTASLGQTQ